jgi:hypothetical protein
MPQKNIVLGGLIIVFLGVFLASWIWKAGTVVYDGPKFVDPLDQPSVMNYSVPASNEAGTNKTDLPYRNE